MSGMIGSGLAGAKTTILRKQNAVTPSFKHRNNVSDIFDKLSASFDTSIGKISTDVARASFSTESAREDVFNTANTYADQISREVSTALKMFTFDKDGNRVEPDRIAVESAALGGLLASDIRGFLASKAPSYAGSDKNVAYVQSTGAADAYSSRAFANFANEAYDEREQKQAVIYSMIYNAQAARQDEFSETFFRTTLVAPDAVGLGVTIRLMSVFDDFKRNVSGELEDHFNRKNILRAYEDPTILKNEMTLMTPVYRTGNNPSSNEKFFMKLSDGTGANLLEHVAELDINDQFNGAVKGIENEIIKTAPLKTGERFDWLGITSTDALISAGMLGPEDSIDPTITLKSLYVTLTDFSWVSGGITHKEDIVLKFATRDFNAALFTYSTQGNYRVMTLNFDQNSVLISANNFFASKTPAAAAAFKSLFGNGSLIGRVRLAAQGTVNIQTAETVVRGSDFFLEYLDQWDTVNNKAVSRISAADPIYTNITAQLNKGSVDGYDLIGYRTNINRRQRGQLIDTTYFTQLYNIPLRGPITALHPVTTDGTTDAADLSSLITATHIRTSNAAVAELLRVKDMLKEHKEVLDNVNVGPDVLGVARFLVKPVYMEDTIDYATDLDSIKTHERTEDLQSLLVIRLRDMVYNMYRDSQYQAVANALSGGVAPVPEVIIGTDPILARYLQVTGDLRTLGNEFNVRIVHTLDRRVKGKLFIAFGQFGQGETDGPNPLHFGTMGWKPELTVTLPISRSGQISKELTVQPSFLHWVNCPILGYMEVHNIPEALGKVAMDVHSVS